MQVPLPMGELWEELQAEVEQLTGQAGLQIIRAMLEDELSGAWDHCSGPRRPRERCVGADRTATSFPRPFVTSATNEFLQNVYQFRQR